MNLRNIAFVEIWVSDAASMATRYEQVFGFQRVAEATPATGLEGLHSIVLEQGSARLIMTSSVDGSGPVADFVLLHGDSVRDIAFEVDDAQEAFAKATSRGASVVQETQEWTHDEGRLVRATVSGFGEVVHSLIQRSEYSSFVGPMYRSVQPSNSDCAFSALDHVAMCLKTGTMDDVAEYYKHVFDFEDGISEYIETDLSGMNARVVQHGLIRFPLQEPLEGQSTGPIAEFIELNCGPGVYHVGLLTDDICKSLRSLHGKVKTLQTPDSYYDMLPKRVGQIEEDIADLRDLGVLVDKEEAGFLLQTFTRSVHPRQTFFVEVIQRKGEANGFGSGNIRALFDAVEADRLELASMMNDQTANRRPDTERPL